MGLNLPDEFGSVTHFLRKPLNRDSHSVLGSIFLNPSVAAGVAFGSGGTQIHKGPAFTNRALYCRVDANGQLKLAHCQEFSCQWSLYTCNV